MPVMHEMEIKTLKPRNRRYLGSKTKLLPLIKDVIEKECIEVHSFLDLFAGTGVVGESFNTEDDAVFFNDSLVSNYYSYLAWFGNQPVDSKLIHSIVKEYNEKQVKTDNYVSLNFSDTFFSKKNCRKIGFIRENIEIRYLRKEINEREKAILITSLLLSMDRIANTVGHYDAYRKNGDLSRELIIFNLELDDIKKNHNNKIFCSDANELVRNLSADLVYIDPPYNSRQYSDAYHLLENIAEWNKPDVVGIARKYDRNSKKSKYSLRSAPKYFEDLIENIKAKYILVSYNNMGIKGASRSNSKISDFEILNALSKRGEVSEFSLDYQQFTTGKTRIENHKERLFLCKVGKPPNPIQVIKKSSGYVKSPLNYTGGKHKLLDQILEKFPKKIETFVDLFAGGFNVGANIDAKHIIYNDIQTQVLRIIKILYKEPPEKIIGNIEKIINVYNLSDSLKYGYNFYNCNSNSGLGKFNKEKYYILRDDYNNLKGSIHKDYLFLTLIIYSFNNQIRFNSNKKFNMPVGKRDFNSSIRSNLIEFATEIKNKNISFQNSDFEKVTLDKGSFVYCDPPYLLGLASYNESDGWNPKLEDRLLKYLSDLDKRGIKFALSNVIEHKGRINHLLYEWVELNHFNKIFIKSSYRNSNYQLNNKDEKTREVLITNY